MELSTRRIERLGSPSEKYTADWIKTKRLCRECPGLIRSCEDEECFAFVHPDVDVFCIQVDNWLALQHRKRFLPVIELSIRRRRYKPYPPNIITKTALLYDPLWATDLPSPLYNLPYGNSARGYLVYLIQQGLASQVRSGRRKFYIIDREAKWLWTPPLLNERQVLYWDCDAEYIEIEWSQVVPEYNESNAVNAAGFIQKLGILVGRMWAETHAYGSRLACRWISGRDDPLTTTIKLLVRRDNQVKRTTLDCQPTCYGIGWCVCNKEERACNDSAREHDAVSGIQSMLG